MDNWRGNYPGAQRGGSFTVSGWVALLALAALAAVALYVMHNRHISPRCILYDTFHTSTETSHTSSSDYYETHTFPPGMPSCDVANTICYTRI